MNHLVRTAARSACTVLLLAAVAGAHATDVGVSIEISQPGVYGRVDIGRFPQPQVVVAQPVIITRPAVGRPVQPVYLWVPPGHRKHWSRHCGRYDACGVPVYFVTDDWYGRNVDPAGRGKGKGKDGGPSHGRGPEGKRPQHD